MRLDAHRKIYVSAMNLEAVEFSVRCVSFSRLWLTTFDLWLFSVRSCKYDDDPDVMVSSDWLMCLNGFPCACH